MSCHLVWSEHTYKLTKGSQMGYMHNPFFIYPSTILFIVALIALYYDLKAGRMLWAVIDVVIFPVGAVRGAMMLLGLL